MRIALRLNLYGGIADSCRDTEMSPGMRRIHDRVARRFSARGTAGTDNIVPKLRSRIVVNDQEFKNPRKMPPEYRRFYEEMLAHALPVQRAVDIVTRAEHSNFIKRTITLAVIAAACATTIVYLWMRGYYA